MMTSYVSCTLGVAYSTKLWPPIYKISYDLSYDYLEFIVRSTCDSDLQRAKISLGINISSFFCELYFKRSYDIESESYRKKTLRPS